MTQEGLDQIRKIRENMNTSRVLVESESATLEVGKEIISNVDTTKRTLVKPISVQEVKSGKIFKLIGLCEQAASRWYIVKLRGPPNSLHNQTLSEKSRCGLQ